MIKVNKFVSITVSLLLALSSSCAITGTQTIPNTNFTQMFEGKKEPYYGDISLKLDTGLIEKAGGKLTSGRFQKDLLENNSFSVKGSKNDEDKKVEKLDRYDFSKHKNNAEHVRNRDKILFNPNLPNLGLDGLTPYEGQIKSGLTSIAVCEVNGVEEKILTGKLIVEFNGDYNTKLQQFLDRYGAIKLNSFVTPDNTLMVLIAIADTSKQVANLANNIKQTNAIAYPATQSITFSSVDALKTVAMFYDIYVNSSDLVSGLAFNHPAEETESTTNNTRENKSFSTKLLEIGGDGTRSSSPDSSGNIVTDEEVSLELKSTSLDWLVNQTLYSPEITKAWQYSQGEDTVVAVLDNGFGLIDKYKETFNNRVIYKPEFMVNDFEEWKPYCEEWRRSTSTDKINDIKTPQGYPAFAISFREEDSYKCYPTYSNKITDPEFRNTCAGSEDVYKGACYDDSEISNNTLVHEPKHGFEVSSIIASEADNFKHIVGVAPKSKILPISYNSDGVIIDDYTLILSLSKLKYYVYSGGKVDVLNISTALEMGLPVWNHLVKFNYNNINVTEKVFKKTQEKYNNPIMRVMNDLIYIFSEELKIPVIVGAGNENKDSSRYLPAKCDDSITVGAYKISNTYYIERADFPLLNFDSKADKRSNYGQVVDIWANGYSTYTLLPSNSIENYVYSKTQIQGSSFATPIVSGTVALIKSLNNNLKGSEVKNILKNSGYTVPTSGDFKTYGNNQVVLNSLNALNNTLQNPLKYTSISGIYNSNNSITSNNSIYYPTIDYTDNSYSDLVGKNVTVTGWADNNTKTIKVLQIREGSTPQNNEKWYIRIYNVDDSVYSAIKINDCTISETNNCFDTLLTATYGQDTGYYDITNYISNGDNTLKFQMYNYGQGYTWGFQIKRGDSIVFNQLEGTAGVSGANNNDQNSTYRYVYDKDIKFSTNDRNLVETNNLTGEVTNRTY